MFGGGKGMGGGGGSMIKVVGRAAVTRAGVTNLQETISSSSSSNNNTTAPTSPTSLSRSSQRLNSSNNVLSLASAPGFPSNTPVSIPTAPYWQSFGPSYCGDDYDWVSVDELDEDNLSVDDIVFASVPSLDEVHGAVSALNQVFDAASYSQFVTDKFSCNVDTDVEDQISGPTGMFRHVSPVGSDFDWREPSPSLCNSRALQHYGPHRVYDAIHLLQNEPSIQRMVLSLSSDRAVWNAVMNNEAVRELRETYNAEEKATASTESSDESGGSGDSNPAMDAVRWIFENTKARFMEAIEKITKLMNELFKTGTEEKTASGDEDTAFEEKVRTSFLLSVVVLLVVVVARANGA